MEITRNTYTQAVAFMALSAMLFVTSVCDEEEHDYKWADKVAADCPGVYFDGKNPIEFMRAVEDDPQITIKLLRTNTSGALDVPLVATGKSSNITPPATAHFNAGEAVATVTATYASLNPVPSCTLTIPSEYTNPYSIKEGSAVFKFGVYESQLISNEVTYIAYSNNNYLYTVAEGNIFGDVKSSIYQLRGQNTFIWANFFGSGLDVRFKLDTQYSDSNFGPHLFDPDNLNKCSGDFIPLDHFADDEDGYGWYLTTEAEPDEDAGEDAYHTWTPEGADTQVSQFYNYYYYSAYSQSYIDVCFNASLLDDYDAYAYVNSCMMNDDDNYYSYYVAIKFKK